MEIFYFIADGSHFEELAKLRYEFKKGSKEYDPGFIREYAGYLERETGFGRIKVFCAADKDEIIGNMNLILIPKTPKPGSAGRMGYVTNAYVRESYRNQGIGGKILEHMKTYAEVNKIETIVLWPSEKAVEFYKRHEFAGENAILEWEADEYKE